MNSTKKFFQQNERSANGYWIIPFVEKGQDSGIILYFTQMLQKTNMKWAIKLTKRKYNVKIETEIVEEKKIPTKLKEIKIWFSAA